MDKRDYNFSHRIDKLSFGSQYGGIVQPLEGDEKIADKCEKKVLNFISYFIFHVKVNSYTIRILISWGFFLSGFHCLFWPQKLMLIYMKYWTLILNIIMIISDFMNYQYFIQIVPTDVQTLSGVYSTYQYSVREQVLFITSHKKVQPKLKKVYTMSRTVRYRTTTTLMVFQEYFSSTICHPWKWLCVRYI